MSQHDETVRDDESAAVAGERDMVGGAATRYAAKGRTKRPFASALTGTVFTLIVLLVFLMFSSMVRAGSPTTVGLGLADSYAILASSEITNTGETTITGDVGLHPGPAVTGFADCTGPADCVTLDGELHVADSEALDAKNALDTAYTDAAGRTPLPDIPTELGSTELTPGVYKSASTTFGITGTLTLNASTPGGVFIFYMGSTEDSLIAAVGSSVVLTGEAQACNVFWVVAGTAKLNGGANTATKFVGTIMAYASITLGDNVTVDGRLLARTGNVTLIHDTITRSGCAGGPGATATPGGPGATATPGGPGATPGGPPPTSTLPQGDIGDDSATVSVALLALAGLLAAAGLVARRRVESPRTSKRS